MATLPFMFVCLLLFSVNCEVRIEKNTNNVQTYDSEITAVLNDLNSSSFKVYKYKEATLLDAQIKADITELTLEINVDCINKYPDVPCSAKVLTCHAFVQKTPEGITQVLNNVNCKPKPEILIEEPLNDQTNPSEVDFNESKSIALSNEAVSSEVSEPFVAIRRNSVPCLGCPFDLNTKAEGVDELIDLALEHVGSERPNKPALVKVLKLQQQVVSGVKYILVVEVGTTVCSKDVTASECPLDSNSEIAVCQITYLQKPWISKAKHIISNNCTVSQEYVRSDGKKSEISNEIDSVDKTTKPSTNFDHIAESGSLDELSPSRLSELESQIIFDFDDSDQQNKNIPTPKIETVAPSTVVPQLTELESQIILEQKPQIESVPSSVSETQVQPKIDDNGKSGVVTREGVTLTPEEKEIKEPTVKCGDEEMRPKRDESLENTEKPSEVEVTTLSEEGASTLPEEGTSTLSQEATSTLPEEGASTLSIEESTTLPKEETTTVSKGDSSEEGKSKSSEENAKSKSSEEDSSEEKYRGKRAVPQLEKISPEEKGLVKNLADFAAAALDNIDDDNHKRVILQILGAKKMVGDDGVYYHLIMRMGISRCLEDKPTNPHENCREKLFENYTKICKVQVYVNDDVSTPKVVKSQCQNIKKDKNDSNRTNYSRFKRQVRQSLAGGQQEIDKNSDKVKELLSQGLNQLNAEWDKERKYKSVDVLSATSQVVAGVLYRIEIKLAESDCLKNDEKVLENCNVREGATPKKCQVKVWEKQWINFREYTISCDGEEKKKFQTTVRDKSKRSSRSKRDITEATEILIPEEDEYVRQYLDAGLSQLEHKSSHKNKLKISEIIFAVRTTQDNYKIKARIVETDCKKKSKTKRHKCGALENSKPKTCTFKISETVGIPNSRTINIDCENGPHLTRKSRDLKYSMDGGFLGHDDHEFHFALFTDFIKKHKKRYTKKQFKHRFEIFRQNLFRIRVLNTYEQGTAKYGVTRFADLTPDEFSKSLGLRPDLRNENETPFAHAQIPDIEIPTEFDWRNKGVVTEVKNQEQCGSCWAFSVTGNVEGQYAIKHGKLLEFSEQELVDCDTEDQGCNGGLMDNAYREIEKLGGLETEKDYPYDAEDEKCHFNKSLAQVQLSGALNISHNETDMAKWLVANGPISIAINANAMQFYFGGISHPFKFLCNPNSLDHGVLVVGYGVHKYPLFNKTMPYWIVKNSWGTSWGEQGYYRVYRGDGTCGLNQTPSSAIVA